MNQSHERIGLNGIILGGFAVMGIAAVVGAALVFGALWAIVGAMAVIGAVIVLALAALSLIARFAAPAVIGIGNIRLEAERERNRHKEKLIDKGVPPESFGYKPIPQLEAPTDIPVNVSGVTASTIAPYSDDALNLLALSLQWQRETNGDPTQIAPYHVARKNDYFRDVAVWMRATQFLMIHQIGVERMRGGRKMGTFTISGTVEQAYQQLRAATPPQLS